jgi:hypothetical protein
MLLIQLLEPHLQCGSNDRDDVASFQVHTFCNCPQTRSG